MSNDIRLGACCACKGLRNVRNVIMLSVKTRIPGTGWGCVVCHLPFDGAIAVICDDCLRDKKDILFAVDGFAMKGKRIKIEELRGVHEHDMEAHRNDE